MLAQHLSYTQFQQVARFCRSIDLCRLPLGFDFKRYLLRMLRNSAPSVAHIVDGLTDEGVELLRIELAEFQTLAA